MKEKRGNGKWKGLMLLSLFVLLATAALLSGTVTVVQGAEMESVKRSVPYIPPGETFQVTLEITCELPIAVGIVETIPDGFSFPSSDVSTTPYSVSGRTILLSVVDEKKIKYTVIAPSSGEGTFTGTWTAFTGTWTGEEGKDIEIGGDSDIIVGGGGAGAIEEEVTATPTPTPVVPTVTKATRFVPLMEAGKEAAMVFEDMDVSMIALKADKTVSDVKVVVEKIERTPDIPEPSGVAYTYLDITMENAGSAKIDGMIEFKVGKWWISDNNIDEATITLNRYDGTEGWKMLPTTKVGEDNATVYFEAETPGFSMFAVMGEKKVEVEAAATPTPTTIIAAPTPAATPSPTPAEEVPGFEVFFAAVSPLIAYLIVFRRKRKGGDMK